MGNTPIAGFHPLGHLSTVILTPDIFTQRPSGQQPPDKELKEQVRVHRL